ncbi:MAG: ABC transporter permease subunit [Chlorobi bacterium]|nr:ABC transporter permease subunit [Chlorobiota bacterium]
MWQIFRKDFKQFFSSATGYVVMTVFALVAGLFFWYLEGDYNLMFSGFADLKPVFDLVPWLLILILPAVSMRSFAEEYRTGTIELLLTKPLRTGELVAGKWLAVAAAGILMLLPLGLYIWSINRLMIPADRLDYGVLMSSFMGLTLLVGLFAMVGVWVSSLTQSQMAAYLGGVFLLFLLYYGLYGLASFQWAGSLDYTLRSWSLTEHYRHFTDGLILAGSVGFFLLGIWIFGMLTVWRLKTRFK